MFPEIPTGILYSTQNNKEFGTHQSFLTKKIPPSSRNDLWKKVGNSMKTIKKLKIRHKKTLCYSTKNSYTVLRKLLR